MAGYIRQSSFSDGDTITAALFNNEYNQILNSFSNTSGHAHDGTTAEGPVIGLIGDAGETAPNNKVLIDTTNNYIEFYVQVSSSPVQQLYIADGAIVPVTDNDIDLGTSSLEFKDGYFDGTLYADAINFNGTAITSTAAELNILDGVTSTAAELNILDGVTSTAAELNILDGVTASAADINLIDGITNGTVIASKAIVTDANKDITGGRNITISGELDAATLDISGDADIDGTLEADAITIAGVTLAETISDTVGAMVSSNTETNITVTYDDSDNTLDFVIGTLNQDTTGTADNITVSANNSTDETVYPIFVDGATGSQGAETDTGLSYNPSSGNLTIGGELIAATLDISGNVDIDGTLEADAITVNGTTLAETISDTVGAMVSSNTETNITVTYDDTDNTLDFVIGTLNQDTTGLAATATALATARTIHGVSFDGTANIDLSEVIQDTVGAMVSSNTESGITVAYQDGDGTLDFTVGTLNQDTTGTADNITVSANNSTDETVYPIFVDGATGSQGAESDTGLTYNPSSGILTATAFAGALTGNVTGNASGTAATVTGAAQSNITSLGTLTTLTVDNVIVNGTTIGHTDDTDLMTLADGVLTVAGEVSMTTLDIGGTNVTSTAAELNFSDGVTSNIQTQLDTKATTGKAIAMALVFG
jgi:cytoskeletal protein CcmA (bactofilin family)